MLWLIHRYCLKEQCNYQGPLRQLSIKPATGNRTLLPRLPSPFPVRALTWYKVYENPCFQLKQESCNGRLGFQMHEDDYYLAEHLVSHTPKCLTAQ